MQRALAVPAPGEKPLPLSPPPARHHHAAPPPTLYHAGHLLHVREGMTAAEALGAVAAWPARAQAPDAMFATRDEGASGSGDMPLAVANLITLLRRDMLASAKLTPNAPTLAIMGLLVPTEVCALRRGREDGGAWHIAFLAMSADCGEVRAEVVLEGALEAVDVAMVYALAPALAAFLRSHGVASEAELARLVDGSAAAAPVLGKGLRPVVPECVLAPVRAGAADTHVARRLVHARLALLECGYHVPALGYVPLHGATLETWLQACTDGVRRVREQIRRVDDMQRELAKAMEELVFLTRISGLHRPDPSASDAC